MTKTKMLMTAVIATVLSLPAFAADKEVTIKGEGQCAKCSLKETKTCQNAIKASDGKTYYLAENDTSKAFHKTLCTDKVAVSAVGTVKEVDGKQMLTVSKIEEAKK